MPAEDSRWSSSTSSVESSPYSPMCRTGATMKWPDEYGYLFSSAMAFSPRCTTSRSSSSPSTAMQKTHPGSSSADLMYSRRQGAHSCFTRPSLERLIRGFDRSSFRLDPGTKRGEEHHRPDHGQDHDQRRSEEDRLECQHVGRRTSHPRFRLRGPESFWLRNERAGRVALDDAGPADGELRAAWAVELRGEHAVQGGLEGELLLLAAPGEAAAEALDRLLRPGLDDVLLDRRESRCVRREHRVVAPRRLRQAELHLVQVHERLGEGLAGVLQIVLAFVTGERHAGGFLLADALVSRPALRAESDRRPGVVEPVGR